ncbi:MAG: carboxymuconolactone decarboxylase family protein [Thermoleophilia bacterium]
MPSFPVHTRASAPEASRVLLDAAQDKFGMIPNLMGVLATSPAALGSYLHLTRELEGSSLTPVEQQVVLIATSAENRCEYCVSVHSAVAGMVEMPPEALDALRAGRDPEDPRLAALARFTRHVVEERGWVDESELGAFLDAGFGEQQVLEVLTGVALKTLSNYTNHIAGTPLDAAFERMRWTADAAA